MSYGDVTEAFRVIGNTPKAEDVLNVMPLIERFVVLLYDRTSTYEHVNEARMNLFAHKGRSVESISQPMMPLCSTLSIKQDFVGI